MPLQNKIIIASAGSGKTTKIVNQAGSESGERAALITFTNNNTEELREKAFECFGLVPKNMTVGTWYRFLLHHFVRPYQRFLYLPKVKTLMPVHGQSAKFVKKAQVSRYYFNAEGSMYMDKASEFACEAIARSGGKPLHRIEKIFDHLYIDEVQDLAGWDLELVEHLLNAEIAVTLVGDVRQATYRTNNARKNKGFVGPKLINKFEIWAQSEHTQIEHHAHSHRCVQEICDFADAFYPDLPTATSLNTKTTGHDGVFALRESDVPEYFAKFSPQPLRLDRRKKVSVGCPMNYGESKGKGFERVLIFPHAGLQKVLKTGVIADLGTSDQTKAKVYVGITRASQSVAFVVPDNFKSTSVPNGEIQTWMGH